MMKPLVTVAIPTFNRADNFLRLCLESVLAQTYRNLQIIVSDNASSDSTPSLMKNYRDSRIRYFRHDFNIGANNNFNFCLRNAGGVYFLLLQDDDLIDPDLIQICMERAEFRDTAGLIRSGTRIIDSNGKIISEYPNGVGGLSTEDFFLGWFSGRTALYLCSTLFNTARLREIGGFSSPKNLFQDVVAEARLAARWGRVDVPEIKASFRKHSGEMTFSVKVKDWCRDSLYLLDLLCALSKEKKKEVQAEGMNFFRRINYSRAGLVRSPLEKIRAYYAVFNKFNKRPPEINHFLRSVRNGIPSVIRSIYKGMRPVGKKPV